MTNSLSNWQDVLDHRLVNRLTRPLRQPGMMNMAMGQRIINRCDRFLNRLPLLNQQMQRWGNTNTLSSESMPIVYAQPITLAKVQPIENRLSNSQSIFSTANISNTIIQRKLDNSQSLPIPTDLSNSTFTDKTTQFLNLETQINQSEINSPEIPVVSPQPTTEKLPLPTLPEVNNQQTENQTPATLRASAPLREPNQPIQNTELNILAQSAIAASENPVVTPQPITQTSDPSIPILPAKIQNPSTSQSSVPINNQQTENQTPPTLRASTPLREPNQPIQNTELNILAQSAIAASENPVVTPQPITQTSEPSIPIIPAKIQNPSTSQSSVPIDNQQTENQTLTLRTSAPLREPNHINLPPTKTNKTNNNQNISFLPLVPVISPINPPLKPQSLPLPLAKTTPSSRSNNQTSNRNSTSHQDYSSPRKNFAPAVSPTETVVSPIATRNVDINVNAIASQVERKLMRRLVIESERRGKNR
ncbi:hypothetical protein Nos7524_1271 [Nostoc sp. PCC 7524]|uniref:hypothetical protein n=1 Tax=Nostoc sp. (strain ATCC 29411 / PCC 7524) TaxID=28072 RepID=UPI00029F1875|nr:hypothetical protein [Nostoc sp. PCC 7524]AFY47153.1 hypothetical protein Nos7524_1271 [Nostoc sp. PCC 7524]